ncbi:MAG TPA: trypsin-like peptidase domain-containing protein, partial [Gemmataceae bacterium]|nr:trypsin-like peptidase domain-containing protein [Gemmataceae bacterium]
MSGKKLLAIGLGALVIGGACLFESEAAGPEGSEPAALRKLRLPKDAAIGASPDQIARAILGIGAGEWKPLVNDEKSRGPAAEVYPRVAPAVVIVRTDKGHGTGAIIDPAGWILTNHHVIADAEIDPETGARKVTIHLGRLDGDFMRLLPEGVPGLVYKSSEEKDLALIKLTRMPAGFKKLPFLALAKKAPGPGSDCVSVGHPASGLLWTVRGGEVAGVGDWPREMTDLAAAALGATADEREQLAKLLAKARQRKVVLSTCGINSGDSGGPLVNSKGELIAVTFAMPKEGNRGTAKFSYHVHLDEAAAFVAERPKTPRLVVPDSWPAGVYCALRDLDEDGKIDTALFGAARTREITGLLLDLKEESDPRLKAADLSMPEGRRGWHYQFALHLGSRMRAFYDTDNDGQFDLILFGGKGKTVDYALRRDKDKWVREDGKDRR